MQWTAFHFETTTNRAHSVNSNVCYYTMDIGPYCSHFITKVILKWSYFHSIITETNYPIPSIFSSTINWRQCCCVTGKVSRVARVGNNLFQDGDRGDPICRECRIARILLDVYSPSTQTVTLIAYSLVGNPLVCMTIKSRYLSAK